MDFFNSQSEKCHFCFAPFFKHIKSAWKMAAHPCAARRVFFNSLLMLTRGVALDVKLSPGW